MLEITSNGPGNPYIYKKQLIEYVILDIADLFLINLR